LFKRDVSTEGEGVELRLLFTRDFDSQIYRAQLEAIRNAQRRIYMQNAYFSDDLLIYELAKARRRGVDVRVIITERADDATMNLSNEATISVLLRNGVRVYHYPGMSHVKAAVYDGWACVGSGNFDKMSLQVNEEMNLGISDPATVRALVERVFEADFERSVELSEAPRLTLVHRLAEMVADELL
ncbi:MAG: phospholipase D-like domain-containing protein, partial [Gammaproteobacteria bacterium]